MTRSFVFKPNQGLTAINSDNGLSSISKTAGDVAVVTGSNVELMANPNYSPTLTPTSPALNIDPKF